MEHIGCATTGLLEDEKSLRDAARVNIRQGKHAAADQRDGIAKGQDYTRDRRASGKWAARREIVRAIKRRRGCPAWVAEKVSARIELCDPYRRRNKRVGCRVLNRISHRGLNGNIGYDDKTLPAAAAATIAGRRRMRAATTTAAIPSPRAAGLRRVLIAATTAPARS